MYCPKCLNDSLNINSRGVMHIIINGKQMDAGRFLYNLENKRQFIGDLTEKLEEFFKWYSGFNNIENITSVEICTSDVSCEEKCPIPVINRYSVIDCGAIESAELLGILKKLGEKYQMNIELNKG